MPRGNRCILIAVVGWLSLAAAQPQPSAKQEQAQANAELNASTTRIVDAIDNIAAEQDAGCEDRKDQRSSDLCAQWKAADAARDAADYTFLAVLLSFIGTTLVALTFWEQRKVSRAELRAYVAVDAVGLIISGTDGGVAAHLKITNNGQTPAFNARWGGNIVIRSERKMELDMAATNAANTHPEGRATALSINSGQSANAVMYGMPKPDLADYRKAVKGDGVSLYVFGTVWYNDAFKRPRYTNFCFEAEALLPLERAKVGQLENSGYSMTPFHNDSN